MPIALNETLLKYHALIYGIVDAGQPNAGALVPVAVDENGVLQVTVTSGGQTSVVIPVSSDNESENQNAALTAAFCYAFNTPEVGWDRLESAPANADALAPVPVGNLLTIAQLFGWNGASFDRVRIANVFHTVSTQALGLTAVWTPAAGKKFRLMGYTIDCAGTTAATGPQAIKLEDGGTVIKNHIAQTIQTQTASISGGADHMGCDLGQGQLSAAINNVLTVNLSVAMATGAVTVNVWGTEE